MRNPADFLIRWREPISSEDLERIQMFEAQEMDATIEKEKLSIIYQHQP